MKKVAFKTLGCRLNLYETDSIASQFSENGYEVVEFTENADVYVVNTCTVTNQSDHKSRQEIKKVRKRNPDAITLVTGCMATNYKESLQSSTEIDYVVDNDHKTNVFTVIDSHLKGEIVSPDDFEKDLFGYDSAKNTLHTRSFVKIQDGCNNFCTFCIIPKVRGRASSRPVDEVLKNIEELVGFGFKEVVLTGVNLGTYKSGDVDFEKLVEKILDIPGDFRVRISSIEPDGYSESFFRLFKNPKLTQHMHICLQSGSESVLKRMKRMYTAKEFRHLIKSIKHDYPTFNITTDVIVGFPGETEDEFNETISMMKDLEFGHVHTFKYSLRRNTRAESFPDHLSDKLKSQRSEIVRKLSEEHRLKYRRQFIGKKQTILIEKLNDGWAFGHGENYIPVKVKDLNLTKNHFYEVTISNIDTKGEEPVLIGEI